MRLLGIAVAALSVAVLPAAAGQKSKAALIEEMLQITNAAAMFDSALEQQKAIVDRQLEQTAQKRGIKAGDPRLADTQKRIYDVMRKAMTWNSIKPSLVAIYNDLFTEEELAGIVAFNKTPAGQALTRKTPELMRRSMEMGMKQMQSVLPEIQRLAADLESGGEKHADH